MTDKMVEVPSEEQIYEASKGWREYDANTTWTTEERILRCAARCIHQALLRAPTKEAVTPDNGWKCKTCGRGQDAFHWGCDTEGWDRPADEELRRDAEQTAAARDVLAERQRQISAEGWTPEHDDEHDTGELAAAAACYAGNAAGYVWNGEWLSEVWPWECEWWKPKDRRRNLVKAGALILAEIERLDRAALAAEKREG